MDTPQYQSRSRGSIGLAIVGLGGAVSTTAIAGLTLLRRGVIGTEGLPLADLDPSLTRHLASYDDFVFGGWDLCPDDLAQAALTHNVLTARQYADAADALSSITPWPAVGNSAYCVNVDGQNRVLADNHRGAIALVRADLRRFREEAGLRSVVMINLASTERYTDRAADIYSTLESFEAALDANSDAISPAMMYAYAAIAEGVPYGNFTPSVAGDIPALVEFAKQQGVPIGGKDGKTGQTMMKTVIAPGLRSRALHVDGWFSTNILGNRDGLALANPDSLKSKITTKGSVLDDILGYRVEDHLVDIRYYKPRGDNKEAWDNIDVTGFLGQQMQIKVNFLCKDSILAAPLVIEIARCLDLASRRGEGGPLEELGLFFKLPQTRVEGAQPEHALYLQEQALFRWLAAAGPTPATDDEVIEDEELVITEIAGRMTAPALPQRAEAAPMSENPMQ